MSSQDPNPSQQWMFRAHVPQTLKARLGWGAELWQEPAQLPGFAALMSESVRLGIPVSPVAELTEDLLDNVIDAALAVVYTSERIRRAVARANAKMTPWIKANTDRDTLANPPEFGMHASHPGIAEAYTEFANLLVWLRALEDRVDRRDPRRGRLGLLPALRSGSSLANETKRLLGQLKADVGADARWLANYTIHESRIPHPLASSAEFREGRLRARVPDVLAGPIESKFDLSYAQGRTVDGFAKSARAAVERFIDELLDAFEREAPARLRKNGE